MPYAFTEQGVAMLSGVLTSPRAIKVNVEIMRAFVRLRKILASHAELACKLEALERKYDAQFKVVFEAIRQLMAAPQRPPKKIGSSSAKNAPCMENDKLRPLFDTGFCFDPLRLTASADFSLDFLLFSEYLKDKKGIEFHTVPG